MKVIGLTGGVGSGKSMVAHIMETKYKAFLINMDQIAHHLMDKGEISYELIVGYFGESILNEEGYIDRRKLANIVYQDDNKLKKLNSFTHPYVLKYVRDFIKENHDKYDLICVESALPLQAELKDFCDEIWYVFARGEIRRERLKKTRNYDEQKIDKIFQSQISDEDYRKVSTHILQNNLGPEDITEQISFLLEKKNNL